MFASLKYQKKTTELLLCCVMGWGIISTPLSAAPPSGYELKWEDRFEGTQLDLTKWKLRAGEHHQATNVPEAVSVQDGVLTITTYTVEGKNFSGIISTEGLFESRYGYWEAQIHWGDSPGTWSAFWTYVLTMGTPIGDPARAGMEIDFVEHRSIDNGGRDIQGAANFTLHWDGYGEAHKYKSFETPNMDLHKGFHTYGVEWTENAYRFYIDDKLCWEVNDPVSKIPHFLVFSTEVESNAWSGKVPDEGYGDMEHSKTKLQVKNVRYYVKQ